MTQATWGCTGRRSVLAALSAALLAGCATPLRQAGEGDHISGRIAVRIEGQADRNVSAGFELEGDGHRGSLLLTTPLGTTAARAQWAPGQAVLQSGTVEQRFPTLEELAAQALGEAVPLAALFDWLRGRPWAGSASVPLGDGEAGFAQLGWRVLLSRWQEGWIEARRDAPPVVTVRARVDPKE